MRDDERCGRSKDVNTPELIGQTARVRVTMLRFKGSSGIGNTPVHTSLLVTDYLTKIGTKTVPQPLDSPDLAPCDFWLFPKLRGCRDEIIEEMKEALTKVTDTLTQEDFHGAFQNSVQEMHCRQGNYFEVD